MEDESAGREQARLLRRAVEHAALGLQEVWMHYFSIGGNVGEMEVEAFLHHALPLPSLERDMLAHAVNELIDHRPVLYAPYSFDLADAQELGQSEPTPKEATQNQDDNTGDR